MNAAPRSDADASAVALDGSDATPSRLMRLLAPALFEDGDDEPAFAPFPLFAVSPLFDPVAGPAPVAAVHESVSAAVGALPAEAFAPKHDDADGLPPAALPSVWFAAKSSDAVDAPSGQLVVKLASVGVPGEASAAEHVERNVGSSAPPIPLSDPPNAFRPIAMRFTRARESETETVLLLASASVVGPDVVGVGVDPSGAEGSGCAVHAFVGAVAVVPGPVAVVVLPGWLFDPVVDELDAVTGWLELTVAGPALPPLADADPPTVELSWLGRTSGCADTFGGSASAMPPHTFRQAMTAVISRSFLFIRRAPRRERRHERDRGAR